MTHTATIELSLETPPCGPTLRLETTHERAYAVRCAKSVPIPDTIRANGPSAVTDSFVAYVDSNQKKINVFDHSLNWLYAIEGGSRPFLKETLPTSIQVAGGQDDLLWVSDIYAHTLFYIDLKSRKVISEHTVENDHGAACATQLFNVAGGICAAVFSSYASKPNQGSLYWFSGENWDDRHPLHLKDAYGSSYFPTVMTEGNSGIAAYDAHGYKSKQRHEILFFSKDFHYLKSAPTSPLRLEYPATMKYSPAQGVFYAVDAIHLSVLMLDENLRFLRFLTEKKQSHIGYPQVIKEAMVVYNFKENTFDIFE